MAEIIRRCFWATAISVVLILVGSFPIAASSKGGGSAGIYSGAKPNAVTKYNFSLSGAAESPPNVSSGTGTGYASIDKITQTMLVNVNFANLSSIDTVAHIHCCTATPFTGTANVATTIPSFPGFPASVTSGTYTNTLDMTLSGSYSSSFITANGGTTASAFAALVAGMDSGRAYFNIHTVNYAGGEIRGFLVGPRLYYLPIIFR